MLRVSNIYWPLFIALGNAWTDAAFCLCVTGDQGSTTRAVVVPLFRSPLDQFKG